MNEAVTSTWRGMGVAFLPSSPGRRESVGTWKGSWGGRSGWGGYMMSSVLSSVNLARGLYSGNLGFVGADAGILGATGDHRGRGPHGKSIRRAGRSPALVLGQGRK